MDWEPNSEVVAAANLTALMAEVEAETVKDFHRWTSAHRDEFWEMMIARLGISFVVPPRVISEGSPQDTRWLPGTRFNIAASCFQARAESVAVIYETESGQQYLTVELLRAKVQACAGGLARLGIGDGVRVAMAMPMTVESVIGYLAVVWAGGTVVSVADTFATPEIRNRLKLAACDTVITQDVVIRGEQQFPMYQKVVDAGAARCIVVETGAGLGMRDEDSTWTSLLDEKPMEEPVIRPVDGYTNLLFSSGTTGDPKVIPWSQSPPIKAATDGYIHQDIKPGDVVAWPTNLGWMMGPWLIYAALLNKATIALSSRLPNSLEFCRFVTKANVTVLGVVPALVKSWRAEPGVQELDWSSVRVVTSTGEASTPDDMKWLMRLTNAPVIEYCGGTEIGGGYLSSTVIESFDASTFTTPCAGLDIRLFDSGHESPDEGEVFIVPPSIGLSTVLLNRDHRAVYYDGVPAADVPLRRHGDQLRRLPSGHYRAMGRSDDTMNLGGIKVSSAEIERTVNTIEGVVESAAVGVPPGDGGPDRLVVFVVAPGGDAEVLLVQMQDAIRNRLNPLFKIAEVRLVEAMPRTASAKVMRRTLRDLV